MAYPAPYAVSYSFANFQSSYPSSPLPGNRLDVELANIKTSIEAVITALKLIQRADGALNNRSVAMETLSAQLQALLAAPAADSAPSAVTAFQMRMALKNLGLLETVINEMPAGSDSAAGVQWACGADVNPADAVALSIQDTTGYSDDQMLSLFAAARLLTP